MKRRSAFPRPMHLLLAAMTLSAVLILGGARSIITQEKSASAVRRAAAEPIPFVIRDEDGTVVLCRGSSRTPALVTQTPVCMLPPEDQSALRSGIKVLTSEEALAVLKDLSG